MASALVGYVTLKAFSSILRPFTSLCDETRFLEPILFDTTHQIFPSTLTRNYWNKHTKLKWPLIIKSAKTSLKIWHQGHSSSKFPFLNLFPFLIPIRLHAPYLGEFNSQPNRVLDWGLQGLES